ncbi:hypothetical protein [Vallicoccus soli]|nr:hypothetical protein [Vallicoccus soli]
MSGRDPDDDLLPEQTSDDRDEGWERSAGDDDDRFLREVPPHHGG